MVSSTPIERLMCPVCRHRINLELVQVGSAGVARFEGEPPVSSITVCSDCGAWLLVGPSSMLLELEEEDLETLPPAAAAVLRQSRHVVRHHMHSGEPPV